MSEVKPIKPSSYYEYNDDINARLNTVKCVLESVLEVASRNDDGYVVLCVRRCLNEVIDTISGVQKRIDVEFQKLCYEIYGKPEKKGGEKKS